MPLRIIIGLVLAALAAVYVSGVNVPGWFAGRSAVRSLVEELTSITVMAPPSLISEVLDERIVAPPPLRVEREAPQALLTREGTIEWTNRARTESGLPALAESERLDAAAARKLQDMFERQYFAHVSPTGVGPGDLGKAVGYDFILMGENLALGNFEDDRALVDGWMQSPGHRANILGDRYTQIGVAVGKGSYEHRLVWLAVQEFGFPISACPPIDAPLKVQIESNQYQLDIFIADLASQKAELEGSKPKTRVEYDAYNRKVEEYNATVARYNALAEETKATVSRYNGQVSAFNGCAAASSTEPR